MNTWDLIKRQLETKLSPDTFQNWVSKTEFSHIHDSTLCVAVPNEATRDWMDSEYAGLVRTLLKDMGLGISDAVYELHSAGSNGSNGRHADAILREDALEAPRTQLNPKFTFENFVVGKPNELAYAAARRVAEAGAVPFNPLFLYGGVGLGKTHLMHAIAWAIRQRNPKRRIIYLSAEKFMFQFIRALRHKDTMAFKQQFRSVDVLMVDDVQFISGKDLTQEEFFHTFNALVDQNRQIIISADKSPSDLDGLEEQAQEYAGALKVQVAGPWTLAATVERPRGDKVLADFGARRELAQALAEGLTSHVADVRRRLT